VGKLVHILKQSFSMFFERKVMYKEIKTTLMQGVLDKKKICLKQFNITTILLKYSSMKLTMKLNFYV